MQTAFARGDVVGPYVIEGVLGRGASGTVYAVRHQTLSVQRALKVLDFGDPERSARFIREGRIQARLRHSNIVAVHDTLQIGEQLALVLDRVEGPSLEALLRQARPDQDEALRIFSGVLEGVTAAHRAGIVHRDLKPGNVLLDTSSRPPRPRVTDFGVARLIEDQPLTAQGAFIGTMGYAAPEQLRGVGAVSPTWDVYALGVLLYRLVCGEHPFPVGDPVRLQQAMEAGRYTPPESLVTGTYPAVRRAIAAALQPDPGRRPADAAALAAILAGAEPARPAAPSRWRWAITAVGIALPVGVAVDAHLRLRAATTAAQVTGLRLASAEQEAGAPAAAMALQRAAASLEGRDALPREDVARWLAGGAAMHQLPIGEGAVTAVALTEAWLIAADQGGGVTLWDRQTGAQVSRFDSGIYRPIGITVSGDGERVVFTPSGSVGRARTSVVSRRLPDGAALVSLTGEVSLIQSAADAARLGVGLRLPDGTLRYEVRDAVEGTLLWSLEGSSAGMSLSADGTTVERRLEQSLTRWPVDGGAARSVELEGEFLVSFGQGSVLVSLADGRIARQTGETLAEVRSLPEGLRRLGSSRDGRYLHGLTARQVGRIFDLDGERAWEIPRMATVLSGEGSLLIGTREGAVMRWADGARRTVRGLPGRVLSMAEATDGGLAAATLPGGLAEWGGQEALGVLSRAETVYSGWIGRSADAIWVEEGAVWRTESGQRHRLWSLPSASGHVAAREDRVAVLTEAGVLLSVDGGSPVLLPVDFPLRQLRYGPVFIGDSVLLATRSRVYSLAPDRAPILLELGQIDALVAALDGGSAYVAYGKGEQGMVSRLTASAEISGTLGHDIPDITGISALVPRPDGVLAGTWSGHVVRWSGETAPSMVLGPMDGPVSRLAPHPDGVRLAGNTGGGVMQVWREGEALWSFDIGRQVTDLAWSPDGRWLAVTDLDGRLALLDEHGTLHGLRQEQRHQTRVRWALEGPVTLDEEGLWIAWSLEALQQPLHTLTGTGALTNLRVCPDTTRVVPVVPYPLPSSVWAPPESCAAWRDL